MTLGSKSVCRVVGCDVGKASIAVFDSEGRKIGIIDNDPKALKRLAADLDATCFVVCEATGGYEAALLSAMVDAGIPVHRADARKVKAFIRSFGTLGKTDAIDAEALARYGLERHDQLPRWQPPEDARAQLQALVLTRRDFVTQRVANNNRLKSPNGTPVMRHLRTLIDCIDAQIKAIDAEIEALIHSNEPLDKAVKTLKTISGIGPKTAAALIALMPELGTLNRRQAASLAGLAPHPDKSGIRDAYRRTKGGRPEVKRVVFMAALVAAKHNPSLSAFYKRLIEAGKEPIVAITALMRKIIVISNAKLRQTNPAQVS